MGINTATKKFKEDLVNLINKSGLPPCIVGMVLEKTTSLVKQQEILAMQVEAESEVAEDAKSVQSDKLGELSE